MNCVVRVVRGRDKELRIQRIPGSVDDVVLNERIQMMDDDSTMNIKTMNAEIATFVPCDDVVAETTPLWRLIKLLVDPPIESERRATDLASQS